MGRFAYLYIARNVMNFLEQAVFRAGQRAEVCGLLGGCIAEPRVAVATAVHPLRNLSLRKGTFAVDVEELCRQRDAIQRKGLLPLALYHSHRDGSTQPSFRDRKLPWITDLPSLILAWDGDKLHFDCYGDADGKMVPITVVEYCGLLDATTITLPVPTRRCSPGGLNEDRHA